MPYCGLSQLVDDKVHEKRPAFHQRLNRLWNQEKQICPKRNTYLNR